MQTDLSDGNTNRFTSVKNKFYVTAKDIQFPVKSFPTSILTITTTTIYTEVQRKNNVTEGKDFTIFYTNYRNKKEFTKTDQIPVFQRTCVCVQYKSMWFTIVLHLCSATWYFLIWKKKLLRFQLTWHKYNVQIGDSSKGKIKYRQMGRLLRE